MLQSMMDVSEAGSHWQLSRLDPHQTSAATAKPTSAMATISAA